MTTAAPGVGITQPWLSAEQRRDFVEVEAHGGVSGAAVKNTVMFEPWRNDEHIVELHVKRPVGDALFGREQHPDDQLVVAGNPLRAHADVESTNAEREVADADMGQRSAQSTRPSCITSTCEPWTAC